ncbi:MAG: hypothetical protein M3511_08760 [Deinococcota bacterium]|jgi:hypothetical protein|nr:hypothetical protein [Deinococcota bacterium]
MSPRIPRVIKHEVLIRPDARIRIHLESKGSELVHLAITLEHEVSLHDWRAVVRYDTEGGVLHRDRLTPSGDYLTHRERVQMGLDWHQARKNIFDGLVSRAEWHIGEYRKLLRED